MSERGRVVEAALLLWSALLWGWIIEQAARALLPGYGVALPGGTVGAVPVTMVGAWLVLWFGSGWLHPRRPRAALLLGLAGSGVLFWRSGAGWMALLLAPLATGGFLSVRHLLGAVAPPGGGRARVRLLLTTILLGMMGLLFLLWVGLLVGWRGEG